MISNVTITNQWLEKSSNDPFMNQNNINKIKTEIKDITNNLAEKLKISEKENRNLE